MANDLNDALKKAIEEHLPATTAGALRDHLAQAAEDKKNLEVVSGVNEKLKKELKEKGAKLAVYYAELEDLRKLKARELNVEERERGQELELERVRRRAAEQRSDELFTLVSMVCKNPRHVYSRSVTSNKNVPVENMGATHYVTDNEQVTETSEETSE